MGRSQARAIARNRLPADGVQVALQLGPAVTGTPAQGQTLTAVAAVVRGGPSPSEVRQWFRLNPTTNALTSIGGATGATYVVQAGDVGSRITLRSTITQARSQPRVVWAPPTAVVT